MPKHQKNILNSPLYLIVGKTAGKTIANLFYNKKNTTKIFL